MSAMFVIMRSTGGSPNNFLKYLILLLGATFLFGSGWAIKEFYRPSKCRTPDWLKSPD
jgi:hypothetical protein